MLYTTGVVSTHLDYFLATAIAFGCWLLICGACLSPMQTMLLLLLVLLLLVSCKSERKERLIDRDPNQQKGGKTLVLLASYAVC